MLSYNAHSGHNMLRVEEDEYDLVDPDGNRLLCVQLYLFRVGIHSANTIWPAKTSHKATRLISRPVKAN